MATDSTLMQFPCAFSIKTFGAQDTDFRQIVFDLVKPHVPELEHDDLAHKTSSGGRYIAVTVSITAHSRAQLDAIYQDLTAHEAVVMSL